MIISCTIDHIKSPIKINESFQAASTVIIDPVVDIVVAIQIVIFSDNLLYNNTAMIAPGKYQISYITKSVYDWNEVRS